MLAQRIGLAAAIVLVFTGAPLAFEISSPSVSNGSWDKKYIADKMGGCDGQNVSPALVWKDPPEGTKSFMLTMFDPDALDGIGWWHWQVWNIPASTTELPEGAGAKDGKRMPKGAVQGKGDLGRTGYLGPCPPSGTGEHHYIITLYAMKESKLHTEQGATPTMMVADAMGESLGKASVTYTYGQ